MLRNKQCKFPAWCVFFLLVLAIHEVVTVRQGQQPALAGSSPIGGAEVWASTGTRCSLAQVRIVALRPAVPQRPPSATEPVQGFTALVLAKPITYRAANNDIVFKSTNGVLVSISLYSDSSSRRHTGSFARELNTKPTMVTFCTSPTIPF